MTTAYQALTATAQTPNQRLAATIRDRDQVTVQVLDGSWFGGATAGDLEDQLTKLARLLFAERMSEYYKARSRDFGELILREPTPVTPRDHAYVDQRAKLFVEGGSPETIHITSVGMNQWAVQINRDWFARIGRDGFCEAAGRAASDLVSLQFRRVRELKLEMWE